MDAETLVGRTIGHHIVLELLGEGGMGVVYKARDTRLGRTVALKVMHPDRSGGADRMNRFMREAQAASALNHPNIVTIYEIDADQGIDYIAMEFIGGGTLADLLASGPLPVERALRLAVQVADALMAAHAAHIVHRDLKPSNIMLAGGDRVEVVDFGLAKVSGGISATDRTVGPVTATGVILGTVPYMSPEQALGNPVDARSDIFSLGSILYEMLAGRRPFPGQTEAKALLAILHEPPLPITGLPRAVERVIERCLRKDPAERFQFAAELKTALDSCLAPRVANAIPSIAVLPFTNMSGAKEDDYLCEGLAEEIISALTRIPGLRVIARTSAFAVGRMGLDVREAGARLDVETLLLGSVRRAGNRVRVTVQLVSTEDRAHFWSERYDREVDDVFILEDEIANAVASRLRGGLTGEVRPRIRPTIDPEAYQAYLEGRYHFARGTPESLAKARSCYEAAATRDPNYALAYDSLAELDWYMGFFGRVPPRDAFSQGTWNALRAVELDDTLAEAHALLGMLRKEIDYNWPEVDREFARAFELDPESPLVRLRFAISSLLPHGRLDRAISELERVLQADPLSLFVRWWLSIMTYLGRQPARTIREGRHMIDLDPGHYLGHWAVGVGLEASGSPSEAVASLEKAHDLSGGIPFTLGFLAFGYGKAGRDKEARSLLDRVEQFPSTTYVPPSAAALAYTGLGDWDAALERWDRAIEVRDPLVVPIKTYPFLDPVRSDARFRILLRKMNLDQETGGKSE